MGGLLVVHDEGRRVAGYGVSGDDLGSTKEVDESPNCLRNEVSGPRKEFERQRQLDSLSNTRTKARKVRETTRGARLSSFDLGVMAKAKTDRLLGRREVERAIPVKTPIQARVGTMRHLRRKERWNVSFLVSTRLRNTIHLLRLTKALMADATRGLIRTLRTTRDHV